MKRDFRKEKREERLGWLMVGLMVAAAFAAETITAGDMIKAAKAEQAKAQTVRVMDVLEGAGAHLGW